MPLSLARPICLLALGLIAGTAWPASASATGGAPAPGTPGPVDPSVPAPTPTAPAALPAVVADGQVALVGNRALPARSSIRFAGRATVADAGRPVSLQRFDDASASWVPVARATVGADGTFRALYRTRRSGSLRTRVVLARASGVAAISPELAVLVYRSQRATHYGPRLWGNRTACGLRLTRRLLGVAHKTLPCGTQVALVHRGQALVVPVVDRGPYRRGTAWDLTGATADALGFDRSARVGALALRDRPPVAMPNQRRR